jgi:hypothetical protein
MYIYRIALAGLSRDKILAHDCASDVSGTFYIGLGVFEFARDFGSKRPVIFPWLLIDRRAKATIAEPDKTARHSARIDERANDVASLINLLRLGHISGPWIIKSRDHFNGARAFRERPHQWEHE